MFCILISVRNTAMLHTNGLLCSFWPWDCIALFFVSLSWLWLIACQPLCLPRSGWRHIWYSRGRVPTSLGCHPLIVMSFALVPLIASNPYIWLIKSFFDHGSIKQEKRVLTSKNLRPAVKNVVAYRSCKSTLSSRRLIARDLTTKTLVNPPLFKHVNHKEKLRKICFGV